MKKQKTALIIEDEADAQQLLSKIIEEYCLDVTVAGGAANIQDGKNLIESLKPDIVFLDIQLGDKTGFQLLDSLVSYPFKLIITTAYQEFALKAFKYEAIDYVLKPYSPKSIMTALEKVKRQSVDSEVFKRLESLLSAQNKKTKVSLPTSDGYVMVSPDEIVHVSADRAYSQVFLSSDKKKLFISKPLKELETLLPSESFFRLHTSHLINLDKVDKYNKEDGGYVLMTNGSQVPVARRRKTAFLDLLTGNNSSLRLPNL